MNLSAMADTQDRINRRVYHAAGIAGEYTRFTLNRDETIALLKHQSAFAGKDVLDLGVGTGRTAVYLAPLARRYEAIDYSPVMVEKMRASMPALSVQLGDICDLSMFADASFDFVFGSNCVIDAVSPPLRLAALAEFRRVVRAGGTLMFSSHNRQLHSHLRSPRLRWSRNPVTLAANLARWLRQGLNETRMKPLHRSEEAYALFSDGGHDHACLHYYIEQSEQRRQLARAGFKTVDVFDREGRSLREADAAPESGSLIYVALAH